MAGQKDSEIRKKLVGRMKCVSALLAVASLVVASLVACTPQSTSPVQAQKTLKIGQVVALADPNGLEIQRWSNLLAKQLNAKGGWKIGGESYKVECTAYDCGIMDPTKTRTAVEKAVLQDGVKYIVGTFLDLAAVSTSITEPNKVLWMGFDLTDETSNPKFNYTYRASALYFARALSYKIQKDAMAKGSKTDLIVNPDTQDGHSSEAQYRATAKLAGLNVLESQFFPNDTVDYGPVATKIISLKPDLIEISAGTAPQTTAIVGAVHDAGYTPLAWSGSNITSTEVVSNLVKKVGAKYIEGTGAASFDPKGFMKDPAMVSLMDAYEKEYGTWRPEGCFWMRSWFLFQDAVNSTQSVDVDILSNYLGHSKKAVYGLNGWTQLYARPDKGILRTIENAPNVFVGNIRNGALANTGSIVAIKEQYLVSIKAYGLESIYKKYWADNGYPTFPDEPSAVDFKDL